MPQPPNLHKMLEQAQQMMAAQQEAQEALKAERVEASAGGGMVKVTMTGDHIQCFFNGRKYLDVRDTTFPDAGQIGLWSKADAQSQFDDLTLAGR